MYHKILVINSSPDKNHLLSRVFKELAEKGFAFKLWSSAPAMIEQFRQKNWPAKKIYLGPDLNNSAKIAWFVLILLFLQFKFLFSLARLKFNRRAETVVCLNFNEKIIVTAPARLLGFKVVWLENPETDYRRTNKVVFKLFKLYSRLARLAIFNNFTRIELNGLGLKGENLIAVAPGAKFTPYQENIFNKLASASQASFHRKYFTVGAVTALNQKQKIETIFQAVKTCLTVIPNIQLIIVGEGEERKNLSWLAKKMEIENLVWLIGEQEQLKKWLDSFDIFLAAGGSFKLDDYGNIIEAMAAGLPVLAPRNVGLEDLIAENKTGALIEADNNETLARQIIKLHQDKRLRQFLSKNGRERAARLFTLEQMAGSLEQILL